MYYFGVCELTNLPLVAIDLGKYYPSIGDGMATVVDLGLKAIFSALFLYFRVINWFFMSKRVYEDTTFILDSKNLLSETFSIPFGPNQTKSEFGSISSTAITIPTSLFK